MPNRRMSHTELRAQARLLYESDEPWPLLRWLDQWREHTIACDATSVVQLVHHYSRLINDNGPRDVDLGEIARRPRISAKVE